jgi:putative PIN family toxin of toxin-antitoxin system
VRIFLDTNVLASGLATRGLCAELLERVLNECELVTCEPVLQELKRVLAEKFRLPEPLIQDYLELLRAESRIVEASDTPDISFKDSDDIPILAGAIAAKADAFVTGDKALLDLGEIEGMPILSPRQLWQKLSGFGQ